MKIKLPLQMLDGVNAYFRQANLDQQTGEVSIIEHRMPQSLWESKGRPTIVEVEIDDPLEGINSPDDIDWRGP